MKLPDLSKLKPKPKASSGSARGASVKMPSFVEDIYKDMRDRRLLLPALLLIIGIVAVPLLLMTSKEPAPPALAVGQPEGAEAVAPAVLAEEPTGVRDYRERLDELKSKDPFAKSTSDAGAGASTTTGDPADVIVTPTSETGDTATAPATTSTAPTSAPSTPVAPDVGDVSEPQPEAVVLEPRLDVVAGPAGKKRAISNVATGDLLPSKKQAPIAMFVGTSSNLKYAQFVISRDVTETRGEGLCRPRASDCEFLKLKDGERQVFVYGASGKRYTLRVTDIREEVVDRRKVPGG